VATGKGSSYQPLGVRDRRRLNKAIRALRSPFHSVRVAAHREIQRILHKTRGIKRRLHERAVKPAVRKVTPKRLHKPLGVQARDAQAPRSRSHGTPIAPQMPRRGFTPPGGHNQTRGDLKARARAMKNGQRAPEAPAPNQERQQDGERSKPQRSPRDLLDDAGLRPPRGKEERKQGAGVTPAQGGACASPGCDCDYGHPDRKPAAQQKTPDHPMPRGRDPRPDGAQKGVTRRGPDKAATNGHTPKERAPAPARTVPPLPAEVRRAPRPSRTR
jgi:hypothetical protein